MSDVKCELYHDNFENHRSYPLEKASLLISDIPYNLGHSFYASNPSWWEGGRVENGESAKAHKAAFNTDFSFNIADFFAFGSQSDNGAVCPDDALGKRAVFGNKETMIFLPDEADRNIQKHFAFG